MSPRSARRANCERAMGDIRNVLGDGPTRAHGNWDPQETFPMGPTAMLWWNFVGHSRCTQPWTCMVTWWSGFAGCVPNGPVGSVLVANCEQLKRFLDVRAPVPRGTEGGHRQGHFDCHSDFAIGNIVITLATASGVYVSNVLRSVFPL